MASHVVVIDATARRAVVKVTPAKHLSDVLGEACSKLGLDPNQYGLKHQKKQIDLSLSIRLSGLSSGAKLELVQLSRSPSVVSVALQLPESEAKGLPNGRLFDKFPSSTTLWFILRKFEAGVAGDRISNNLTARGALSTITGATGAGRLFYQSPVIQVMGRELSSFVDLQKTLGQLGFNSGSILLRLSFRTSDRPLEEAMEEIDAYFKSVEQDQSSAGGAEDASQKQETPVPSGMDTCPPTSTPPSASSDVGDPAIHSPTSTEQVSVFALAEQPSLQSSSTPLVSRTLAIYAPPSSATPQSAQTPYNESDYVPTIDHAKSHQRQLSLLARPTRLASDAEIAAQESAAQEMLAKITETEVKIRFPDQTQVVAKFGREDSAQALYDFVRTCLDNPLINESFTLSFANFFANSSPMSSANKGQAIIPESNEKLLIRDLRMKGRVLVTFSWGESASLTVRTPGVQVLRPALRNVASEIKVEDLASTARDVQEQEPKSWFQKLGGGGPAGDHRSGDKKGGGVPKWLKLPGKK